jgi:hypothetical protein
MMAKSVPFVVLASCPAYLKAAYAFSVGASPPYCVTVPIEFPHHRP